MRAVLHALCSAMSAPRGWCASAGDAMHMARAREGGAIAIVGASRSAGFPFASADGGYVLGCLPLTTLLPALSHSPSRGVHRSLGYHRAMGMPPQNSSMNPCNPAALQIMGRRETQARLCRITRCAGKASGSMMYSCRLWRFWTKSQFLLRLGSVDRRLRALPILAMAVDRVAGRWRMYGGSSRSLTGRCSVVLEPIPPRSA